MATITLAVPLTKAEQEVLTAALHNYFVHLQEACRVHHRISVQDYDRVMTLVDGIFVKLSELSDEYAELEESRSSEP